MIHKILVAVNRSDEINSRVFQEALDLANVTGASLKLIHVLSVDDKDSPSIMNLIQTPENKQRWEEFERPGREFLLALEAQARAAGVTTEHYQGLGRPGHLICETAKTWGADLIVIGRRRLSGLSELILGSVSNHVAHYAPCSVLIVQGTPSPHPTHARTTQVTTRV
jgi:nucleotide-binding universal stress UspA family protein